MSNTKQRLEQCFMIVFPDVPENSISTVNQSSLAAWDSIAAITLVNVIEEEFQIQMDFEDLEQLTSFDRVQAYLQQTHALPE